MSRGVIIKALSGFYYVYASGEQISCRAKGKFRHSGESPLVGDRVEYSLNPGGDGVIESILPRTNSFIRHAVANIDVMVFVASCAKPVTDPFLIDRVSVIAENSGCSFIVCVNKCDLEDTSELLSIYRAAGFTCLETSAVTGTGIPELRKLLQGKISAFTGNSGVGKSSLLNALMPDFNIETAEISDRLGRGKHTTRHVEFYPMDASSYIADTPGFSSFELQMVDDISYERLPYCFPDFADYLGDCRFSDCRHINEPDCALLSALEQGKIMKTRHESYVKLYDIVYNHKPWD